MKYKNMSILLITSLIGLACVNLTGCGGDSGNSTDDSTVSDDSDSTDETTSDTTDETTESSVTADTAKVAALNANWGANVQVSVDDEYVYIESDGYPNHEIQAAYYQDEDTLVTVNAVNSSYQLPLLPTVASTTTATSGGATGVLVSGAVFYNPFEGDGVTYAVENNTIINGYAFLDSCNGHPVPSSGQYHYHGVPYCITDVLDTESQHSVLIGYMLDGFPIYGPKGAGGATPADLDSCNGHTEATPEFPDGTYHYHTSESQPYVPNCYSGTVTTSTSTMMGPR